jgi:hypothetical protein
MMDVALPPGGHKDFVILPEELLELMLFLPDLQKLSFESCSRMLSLSEGVPPRIAYHEPLPPWTARPNLPLSEGFGELRSLKVLNLDRCFKLKALPAGLHVTEPTWRACTVDLPIRHSPEPPLYHSA